MKLHSTYRDLGAITLPAWQGRQKYMHSFDARRPVMASGYEDFESVVAELCAAARVSAGAVHMTVDEKIVAPGMSQRRRGVHVDGCFMPEGQFWGHDDPAPSPRPRMWAHFCNQLPVARMAVIVAASVAGCIAYEGVFEGRPKNDGDLEHIRDQLGDGLLLPAGRGFLLSPDCVHESVVFALPTQRTFLRLAFSP